MNQVSQLRRAGRGLLKRADEAWDSPSPENQARLKALASQPLQFGGGSMPSYGGAPSGMKMDFSTTHSDGGAAPKPAPDALQPGDYNPATHQSEPGHNANNSTFTPDQSWMRRNAESLKALQRGPSDADLQKSVGPPALVNIGRHRAPAPQAAPASGGSPWAAAGDATPGYNPMSGLANSSGTGMGTHTLSSDGSAHYGLGYGLDAASNRLWASQYGDGQGAKTFRAFNEGRYGDMLNEGGKGAVNAIPQPVKDTIHGAAAPVADAAARVPKAMLGGGNMALGAAGAIGAQVPRALAYPAQMYAKSQGQESPTYNAITGYGNSMWRSALAGGGDLLGAVNPMESGWKNRTMDSHMQDMQGAPKILQNVAHGADTVGGEAASAAATGALGKVTKGLTAAAPMAEGATEAATAIPRAQRLATGAARAYNLANKGKTLLTWTDKTLASMEGGNAAGAPQDQLTKRVTSGKIPGVGGGPATGMLAKAKDLYKGGKKVYGIADHAVANAEGTAPPGAPAPVQTTATQQPAPQVPAAPTPLPAAQPSGPQGILAKQPPPPPGPAPIAAAKPPMPNPPKIASYLLKAGVALLPPVKKKSVSRLTRTRLTR